MGRTSRHAHFNEGIIAACRWTGKGEKSKCHLPSAIMGSENPSLWRPNFRILIVLSAAERAHVCKLRLSPERNLKGRPWCFLETVCNTRNIHLPRNISGAHVFMKAVGTKGNMYLHRNIRGTLMFPSFLSLTMDSPFPVLGSTKHWAP